MHLLALCFFLSACLLLSLLVLVKLTLDKQSRFPKEMLMQKKKSHLVISIKLFTQYFLLFSFTGRCEMLKLISQPSSQRQPAQ